MGAAAADPIDIPRPKSEKSDSESPKKSKSKSKKRRGTEKNEGDDAMKTSDLEAKS
jgi:hypothetical protein